MTRPLPPTALRLPVALTCWVGPVCVWCGAAGVAQARFFPFLPAPSLRPSPLSPSVPPSYSPTSSPTSSPSPLSSPTSHSFSLLSLLSSLLLPPPPSLCLVSIVYTPCSPVMHLMSPLRAARTEWTRIAASSYHSLVSWMLHGRRTRGTCRLPHLSAVTRCA